MFNLQVYTLNLASGKEQPALPGVLAAMPPRRTGRNRKQDLLVVYLKLEGKAAFTPAQQSELLEKLVAIYYRTSGSVTAALRATAASLNDFLLTRNLRSNREGGQTIAVMSLLVLHGELVYLAHCGPTQSFVLGHDEVRHNRDTQIGRGLGVSRNPPIRFFQAKVEPGDLVLLSPRPPESWKPEAFTGSPKLTLEALRRRLFNQAGSDLQAVLVRVQPGKGEVTQAALPGRYWPERETMVEPAAETPVTTGVSSGEPAPAETTAPEPAAALPDTLVEPQSVEEAPAVEPDGGTAESAPVEAPPPAAVEQPPAEAAAAAVQSQPEAKSEPQPKPRTGLLARFEQMRQQRTVQPAGGDAAEEPAADGRPQGVYITGERLVESVRPVETVQPASETRTIPGVRRAVEVPPEPVTPVSEAPDRPAPRAPRRSVWKPVAAKLQTFFGRLRYAVAKAWLGGDAAQQKISTIGRKAITRMTPTREDTTKLSPGTLLFFAVAVPLILSALATTVYIRNGYSEQHLVFLTQAQQFADLAAEQPDPVLKRNNLEQSLQLLNRADEYGTTNESIVLRAQVQQALDILDGVRRLELVPAVPMPFESDVNIVRMVAGPGEDVYVLDGNTGRVLRLIYTRPGYQIDKQFVCGPGQVGADRLIVSPLIDIAPVRTNKTNGPAVMGIDEAGNILYCGPNRTPEGITLDPPDPGWPNLTKISVFDRVLYVLDTKANGVWRYAGDGEVFNSPPRLFFDKEIPPLADVIDLAVYQDDLFLLHEDGTMSKCTYSGFDFSPTRCTVQMSYNLQRDGLDQNELTALESPIIQMQTTESPAYSLFLFSPEGPTLYHFSLALNLQYQYRPRLQGTYDLPDRQATAFLVTANRRVLMAFGNEVYYTELIP